jgi:hypothetical protein
MDVTCRGILVLKTPNKEHLFASCGVDGITLKRVAELETRMAAGNWAILFTLQ